MRHEHILTLVKCLTFKHTTIISCSISALIVERGDLSVPNTTTVAVFTVQTAGYHLSSYGQVFNGTVPAFPGLPLYAVSWQSAWWASAAIAVNTCLQDRGKVCGIKKEFNGFLRSSPLFCLVLSRIPW